MLTPSHIQTHFSPVFKEIQARGATEENGSIARALNPAKHKMREEKTPEDFHREDKNFFNEGHLKAQQAASDSARRRFFPEVVTTLTDCDWDDTIRPEQPINYCGILNAVASAANAQAHAAAPNPDLEKIAAALENYRTNQAEEQAAQSIADKPEAEQRTFPWLALTKEHFVAFAMDQKLEEAKDFRPAIVNNLIDNIHVIAPGVELDPANRKGTFNTIFRHFQRQYDELSELRLRTESRAALPKAKGTAAMAIDEQKSAAAKEKFPLPFPDIKLDSMPGGKKFLEVPTEEGEVRVGQSNRRSKNFMDELYTTGMDKRFHYAMGTPLRTVFAGGKHKMTEFTPSFNERAGATRKTPIYARTYDGLDDLEGTPTNIRLGQEVDGATQQEIMDEAFVEQMYRKEDPHLIMKAIEEMREIGVVFSPNLKVRAIGDTTKDISHFFPLLESGVVKEVEGVFVNSARKEDLDKLVDRAKTAGLAVTVRQHPTVADAFVVLLRGDRSTEPFAMPEKRLASDEWETPDGRRHPPFEAAYKEELTKALARAKAMGLNVG